MVRVIMNDTTRKPDPEKSNEEWLTVLQAVHLIAPLFNGELAAKETIISRLQDGMLEGAADAMIHEADLDGFYFDDLEWGRDWTKSHRFQRDKPFVRRSTDDAKLVKVPARFMARDEKWEIDIARISWAQGQFLARSPSDFELHWMPTDRMSFCSRRAVTGLRLRRADIEAMIKSSPVPAHTLATEDKNVGGRPRLEGWDAWIAELVVMVDTDGAGQFLTSGSIIRGVRARLAERQIVTLKDDTVRATAQAVARRLKEYVNVS